MKKIIDFFKNLFGKKWEYIPTEYAYPIEQPKEIKKTVKKMKAEPKKSAKKKPAKKKTK